MLRPQSGSGGPGMLALCFFSSNRGRDPAYGPLLPVAQGAFLPQLTLSRHAQRPVSLVALPSCQSALYFSMPHQNLDSTQAATLPQRVPSTSLAVCTSRTQHPKVSRLRGLLATGSSRIILLILVCAKIMVFVAKQNSVMESDKPEYRVISLWV